MKIAFFDSGVGGLTVLNEAIKKIPGEDYIYFGDCLNAPYGTKSKTEIRKLVFDAVDFLVGKDLKALVLACNTATSVTINELRAKYGFPVIGMEPAVRLAVKDDRQKRTVVCATDLTLKEEKLNKLVWDLNAVDNVEYLSLQKLVLFAERFEFDGPEVIAYLREKLSFFDWSKFDSIVLGCTHFIYFKDMIRKYIPASTRILDGNTGTVNHLISQINPVDNNIKGSVEYYLSGEKAEEGFFTRYLDVLNKPDILAQH